MKALVVIKTIGICYEWDGWFYRFFSCGHGDVVLRENLAPYPNLKATHCRLCGEKRNGV